MTLRVENEEVRTIFRGKERLSRKEQRNLALLVWPLSMYTAYYILFFPSAPSFVLFGSFYYWKVLSKVLTLPVHATIVVTVSCVALGLFFVSRYKIESR